MAGAFLLHACDLRGVKARLAWIGPYGPSLRLQRDVGERTAWLEIIPAWEKQNPLSLNNPLAPWWNEFSLGGDE